MLSAASCVIGAGLGIAWRPPQRVVAAIMAFGAGALLSALSFELILTAQDQGGFGAVASGAIIGGVSFVLLNELLNGRGGFLRKPATTSRYLRDRKRAETNALLHKLSHVSLLRALPPEEIHAIVRHIEPRRYEGGAVIFHQGDAGDGLYLIDQGAVELYADGSSGWTGGSGTPAGVVGPAPGGGSGDNAPLIARLGSGEAFGEMALLTEEPRAATAVAAGGVDLWKIPKDDFDELVAVSPGLARAVRDLLARNLEAASAWGPDRWRAIAGRYLDAHTLAPTAMDARRAASEHASSAPMGIFLGLLLDGIPESLVIGMSMIGATTVSATLIAGLFLSNFPEALSSAVGMKAHGTGAFRIMGMWTFLMVFIGVGAFFGNALFVGAPVVLIAAFEAAAAGAMLTMISETALPEAYEQGGWLSGLATLLGFLAAFLVKTLSGGH